MSAFDEDLYATSEQRV